MKTITKEFYVNIFAGYCKHHCKSTPACKLAFNKFMMACIPANPRKDKSPSNQDACKIEKKRMMCICKFINCD